VEKQYDEKQLVSLTLEMASARKQCSSELKLRPYMIIENNCSET
jgi:hypothetical protein